MLSKIYSKCQSTDLLCDKDIDKDMSFIEDNIVFNIKTILGHSSPCGMIQIFVSVFNSKLSSSVSRTPDTQTLNTKTFSILKTYVTIET